MRSALHCLTVILLLTGCARDEGITPGCRPDIQATQKLRFVLKIMNTKGFKVQNGGDQASPNPFDNSYINLSYRNTTSGMNSSTVKNGEKNSALVETQTLGIDRQGISEALALSPGSYSIIRFLVFNMGEDKERGTGDDYATFHTSEKPIYFTIEPNTSKNILVKLAPEFPYLFPKKPIMAGGSLTFSLKGLTEKWLFFELKVGYGDHCVGEYTLTVKRGGDMIYNKAFDEFEEESYVSRTIDMVYDTSRGDDFQLFVTKKDGSATASGKATMKYSDLADRQDHFNRHYAVYPTLVFIDLKKLE